MSLYWRWRCAAEGARALRRRRRDTYLYLYLYRRAEPSGGPTVRADGVGVEPTTESSGMMPKLLLVLRGVLARGTPLRMLLSRDMEGVERERGEERDGEKMSSTSCIPARSKKKTKK